jgi:eukaryotic-like serine/threonine-protein kinase
MASIDTDRNLLFGVLALQGEMIDAGQLAEACTAWSARKDRLLGP